MLKASALYMVIILSLVIGVLCSALIVAGYFYRLQYQRTFRHGQLQNNLGSAVNILLTGGDADWSGEKTFSLFGGSDDSVSLKKTVWGIYDVAIAKAFIQRDTLSKIFFLANTLDSAKWAALYLIDEDRPLSVSGKTLIKGDAYIAKAGIKEAYVDNKSYQGDKRLVSGKIHNSDKTLPPLNPARLNQLEKYVDQVNEKTIAALNYDSLGNTFRSETRIFSFGKNAVTLADIKLSGNIILLSDTSLTIENTAVLTQVVVFARSIIVKTGFNGTCQLFASDSISIAHDCTFNYPSCLGVMRFKPSKNAGPMLLNIGANTKLTGLIFTYDKNYDRTKQALIDIGKNVALSGQVYSQGLLGLKDGIEIKGEVFTNRFLYQSSFTRYENYLINLTLNSTALSPYYLSSDLVPAAAKRKKVLQWLETN